MLSRYRQSDGEGRLHFDAHPVLAVEMANFLTNTVSYAVTFSMLETLTLGPRECRAAMARISRINTDWMQLWKLSESNLEGLDEDQIAEQEEFQRLVPEDAMIDEG